MIYQSLYCLVLLGSIIIASTPVAAQVFINELSASNQDVIEDEFGESSDWIELYNAGGEGVELSGFFLSDDLGELDKWSFPSHRLEAGEWMLIFASGRDVQAAYVHTNFKLSAEGEAMVLSHANGEIIDQLIFSNQETDQSLGRAQDASAELALFDTPTPGSTNNNSLGRVFSTVPNWVTEGHFFPSSTSITLSHSDPNTALYFTRDGSMPTATDELYSSAIGLDSTTALRVVAISPGKLASEVISRTFFIGTQHEIGVVSIIGDPDAFWRYEDGILVHGGPNAEAEFPFWGANYWADTKVPSHVEFFTEDRELGIAFEADVRNHGGTGARTKPMKSLRLVMDKKYGSSTVDYPFFPDRDQTIYNRLVLRNASGDFNNAHFRDAFLSRYYLNSGLNLDVLAHKPHAMYVNGAYYGLTNLREKSDEYYVKYQYGIPVEEMEFLEEDTLVVVGDFVAFDSMLQYVLDHDMNDALYFEQAAAFYDLENLAESYVVQSAVNNGDWLANNTKFWRSLRPGGRWRHIVFDLDVAMARYGYTTHEDDNLADLLLPLQGINKHADLFLALLENENYRHYFINRYADLLNTIFHPEPFAREVDRTIDEIEPEIVRHFDRWGWPGYDTWRDHRIPKLYEYLENRPAYARAHIRSFFDLTHEVKLRLKTYPAGAGRIQISTIEPERLPWEGIYFNGVPVALRVIPNEGYRFQYWRSDHTIEDVDPDTEIKYNFGQDDEVTAYFVPVDGSTTLEAYVAEPGSLIVHTHLDVEERATFQLYDEQGRLLQTYEPEMLLAGVHRTNLALPTLASGMYILGSQLAGEVVSVRFLVL